MDPKTKKSILIPIDDSDASVNAARYAMQLAKILNAHATYIHVIDIPPFLGGLNPALGPLFLNHAERSIKKLIGDIQELAKKEQVQLTGEIIMDAHSVSGEILAYAKKQQSDLIIMGARSRNLRKRFLLGSVVNAVMTYAKCPVIIVR